MVQVGNLVSTIKAILNLGWVIYEFVKSQSKRERQDF